MKCSVCAHAQIASIDALLASRPDAMHQVERDFSLSYDAVKRHRRGGHVKPLAGTVVRAAAPTIPAGATPLDLMRGIVAALGAVDASTLSPSAQVSHFDSYRRAVETLSRMEPPAAVDDGRPTWDQLAEFNGKLFEALEPFVQARMAVALVLRAMIKPPEQQQEVA